MASSVLQSPTDTSLQGTLDLTSYKAVPPSCGIDQWESCLVRLNSTVPFCVTETVVFIDSPLEKVMDKLLPLSVSLSVAVIVSSVSPLSPLVDESVAQEPESVAVQALEDFNFKLKCSENVPANLLKVIRLGVTVRVGV